MLLAFFAEVDCAVENVSQTPSRAHLGGAGGGERKFLEEDEICREVNQAPAWGLGC